jgi:hypothetical protein
MTTASFSRIANITASTKRSPAIVNGKSGVATTKLSSLPILPLMPASSEIVLKYKLQSPRKVYQTYTQGSPDVLENDILTVANVDYLIIAVNPWPGTPFLEIIVEKVVVK